MTTKQITTEALALPLAERVSLAQALWQSIETGLDDVAPGEAIEEAIRRDEELSSNAVIGRSHDEVFSAARRAI